jgi:hypothetical protein
LLDAAEEGGLASEVVVVAGQLPAAAQTRLGQRIANRASAGLIEALTEAADEASIDALGKALASRPKRPRAA